MSEADRGVTQQHLWDVPTRLFHWLLVALVTVGWLLGQFGPVVKTWHFYCGYGIGCLVVLRILRGLFGKPPNSFASFMYGPAATLRYARNLFARKPSYWPGHNPMGGWSVIAILLLLGVQVGTGLFASDDNYVSDGPLRGWVSGSLSSELTAIHHINSKLILILVALHVFMIFFYLVWKRENLIRAMITGRKDVRSSGEE